MATRTPRRSRAWRAARSRDRALPADPRGDGRRAPALGRARLPGRRHRAPAALAHRARRPPRAGHVRARAHHGRPALAERGALGDRARRRRQRAPRAVRRRGRGRLRAGALGRSRGDPRAGRVLARRRAGRVHPHGPQRRRLRRRRRAGRRRRAARARPARRLVARDGLVGGAGSWCSAPTRRSTTTSSSSTRRAGNSPISPRTRARSPTTRRACCATARSCAPATPAASSPGSRCCARAPSPSR